MHAAPREEREVPSSPSRETSCGFWIADALTISRIPLAVAFWLVAPSRPWAIAVLAVAALTDVADGRVARWARRTSTRPPSYADAGAWLDPLCDKVFAIMVLAALAVRLDVPVALLLLVGTRELVLVPLVLVYMLTPLRERWHYEFRALPAGKRATLAQFIAILVLVADMPGAPVVVVATAALGLDAAARYLERAWRAASELRTH
jgi:phosphatidylglycerophosphate synthase